MISPSLPLRLTLDGDALARNWRRLARLSGTAACGAAVKADGYGLGVHDVVDRLTSAGCRDFFVATWAEAGALAGLPDGLGLSVLHGVRSDDLAGALASRARPVLNSVEQVRRWRTAGGGACDVMVDTGMNRLGLRPEEAVSGVLDGLAIDTLMSHLACADEALHPLNERQRRAFAEVAARVPARRRSLTNSAGILLGQDYAFDLTRPGIALYGGQPSAGGTDPGLARVVRIEAEVLQVRTVQAGETIGYGASYTASADTQIAILNLGYADGYLRAFSSPPPRPGIAGGGVARAGPRPCPVLGRVSMDLVAVSLAEAPNVGEGDWLEIDFDLPAASERTGLSQYELLTGLGARYQRRWT